MREYTGKKGGMAYKGIYSTSCMPNQKPKRIRKTENNNLMDEIKVSINLFGIFGAIVTIMSRALVMEWKIGLSILLLLSSLNMEVKKG